MVAVVCSCTAGGIPLDAVDVQTMQNAFIYMVVMHEARHHAFSDVQRF